MKKLIILIAAILLTFGVAYADNVSNTDHNLTDSANPYYTNGTNTTDEICVFCHTPHGGDQSTGPLWNRNYDGNAAAFSMYTSTTMDMTVNSQPESVSLACLSCHDGTTAFDSLINEPGNGDDAITDANWLASWAASGNNMDNTTSPVAFMGTDLTNDHPISVAYSVAADADFNAIVNNAVGSLPLYDGTNANQVECGSCHNPHEDILPAFLRISNAASAICVTCHIK